MTLHYLVLRERHPPWKLQIPFVKSVMTLALTSLRRNSFSFEMLCVHDYGGDINWIENFQEHTFEMHLNAINISTKYIKHINPKLILTNTSNLLRSFNITITASTEPHGSNRSVARNQRTNSTDFCENHFFHPSLYTNFLQCDFHNRTLNPTTEERRAW